MVKAVARDMTEVSKKNLRDSLLSATLDGNYTTVYDLCNGPDVQDVLADDCWYFLPMVCENLPEELSDNQKNSLRTLLDKLVAVGNPKELLYVLLEPCEAFKSTSLFLTLLPYLERTLEKINVEKNSMDIVLNTIYSHVKCIPCDMDCSIVQTDDGNQVQDVSSEAVQGIIHCIESIMKELLLPFLHHSRSKLNPNQVHLICDFLLKTMSYPLLYIYPNDVCLQCCKLVMDCLTLLTPTLSTLYSSEAGVEEIFAPGSLIPNAPELAMNETAVEPGLGNLGYLVLCESLNGQSFPKVFATQHRMRVMLPSIHRLLIRSSHPVVLYKALSMANLLLQGFAKASVEQDFMELPTFRSFIPFCHWSMQFSQLLPLRRLASSVHSLLINALSVKSKCSAFQWILEEEQSPDILGHTYSLIKDLLHSNWASGKDQDAVTASCLDMLNKIFTPPAENKTGNLLADLNKISAALNLALYLVLRDRRRLSPYTERMNSYIKQYIEPIGLCLLDEQRSLMDRISSLRTTSSETSTVAVRVGNEILPPLDPAMEEEMIKSNLLKLDLILFTHSQLKDLLIR